MRDLFVRSVRLRRAPCPFVGRCPFGVREEEPLTECGCRCPSRISCHGRTPPLLTEIKRADDNGTASSSEGAAAAHLELLPETGLRSCRCPGARSAQRAPLLSHHAARAPLRAPTLVSHAKLNFSTASGVPLTPQDSLELEMHPRWLRVEPHSNVPPRSFAR